MATQSGTVVRQALRWQRACADARRGLAPSAEQLTELSPEVRTVSFPADEELLSGPLGAHVAGVSVSETDAVDALTKLARSHRGLSSLGFHACERVTEAMHKLDAFASLEHLDLTGEGVEDEPELVDALATAELPALRRLELAWAFPPIALTAASFYPRLTSLELSLSGADALGLVRLLDAEAGLDLTRLSLDIAQALGGGPLDVSEALVTLERERTGALRRISSLGGATLTPSLPTLLAHAPSLRTIGLAALAPPPSRAPLAALPTTLLESLTLMGPVGDEDALTLLRAAPSLRELHAHDVALSARTAQAIGARGPGLEALTLSFQPLGVEGLAALGPALDHVRRLALHHTGATAAALASWRGHVASIEELWLHSNADFGPSGAAALAALELSSLARLSLHGAHLGEKGAVALSSAPWLAHLEHLDLALSHLDRDVIPHGAHALATSPHASPAIRAQFAAYAAVPPKSLWRRLFG
ncbi:MAG: hypothetical protein U0353_17420 [Sandaracinus sp.]